MKEESEKVDLKLNIQKTKIMASGPIISWEIDGETVETVTDFILGSLDELLLYTCANSEGASRAYMCYRSHPHCWSSLYCLCSFCIQRRMWESGFL